MPRRNRQMTARAADNSRASDEEGHSCVRFYCSRNSVFCTSGEKRPDQVGDNCAASGLPPLTPKAMAAVRKIYDEKIRQSVENRW